MAEVEKQSKRGRSSFDVIKELRPLSQCEWPQLHFGVSSSIDGRIRLEACQWLSATLLFGKLRKGAALRRKSDRMRTNPFQNHGTVLITHSRRIHHHQSRALGAGQSPVGTARGKPMPNGNFRFDRHYELWKEHNKQVSRWVFWTAVIARLFFSSKCLLHTQNSRSSRPSSD